MREFNKNRKSTKYMKRRKSFKKKIVQEKILFKNNMIDDVIYKKEAITPTPNNFP